VKARRVHESLLHRMQLPVIRETLDSADFAAFRAKRRDQAAIHRRSVNPDSACATVAGITAFLDAEPSEFAWESAQTLAGPRFFCERLAIN
jgi:hypothetical protein